MLYRKDSFKKLLMNDTSKYYERGKFEVYEEH
jgi:hypothetical protein